jgi:acylphosphatase
VRNTRDGHVEILAQGKESELQKLIDWCRKGPDRAYVENIILEWREPSALFPDFSMIQ